MIEWKLTKKFDNIGGVNIVVMDDSYYQISEGQIDMIKAEVAKGYPIILCMHIPFFVHF